MVCYDRTSHGKETPFSYFLMNDPTTAGLSTAASVANSKKSIDLSSDAKLKHSYFLRS